MGALWNIWLYSKHRLESLCGCSYRSWAVWDDISREDFCMITMLEASIGDTDCKHWDWEGSTPTPYTHIHITIVPQDDTGKKNHNDRNDRVANGRERHIIIWKTCSWLPIGKTCIFSSTKTAQIRPVSLWENVLDNFCYCWGFGACNTKWHFSEKW